MTNIYKLTLKQKSGLLTELQSDTVFGHFCWRMKEISGEEKLIEFLKLFKDGSPVFTISNSLFERDDKIYFPNPLLPKISGKYIRSKNEKIENFINYKKSKDRKYINVDELNKMLNDDPSNFGDSNYDNNDYPKYKEDLRTSVEISRVNFSSKEGQLFSYAPLYIEEKLSEPKKQIYSDTKTILFVKVIDKSSFGNFNCKLILEEIFNIGFGKKKSSGYGEFKFISFEKFEEFREPEDANGFISLSNYLPSRNDMLTDYFYESNLKYGKLGEEFALSSNPFKKPIVLLIPGSVFITKSNQEYYGRCTSAGEILPTNSEVIQNGIAFSLKMKISNLDM